MKRKRIEETEGKETGRNLRKISKLKDTRLLNEGHIIKGTHQNERKKDSLQRHFIERLLNPGLGRSLKASKKQNNMKAVIHKEIKSYGI